MKRPLTPDELTDAYRHAELAEFAVWRLGLGLQTTLPMATCERGFRIRELAGYRKFWIADQFDIEYPRFDPIQFSADLDGPGLHHWFFATKPRGHAKRTLARSEWAALGETAKEARGHLTAAGTILRVAYPDDAKRRPWFRLAERLDRFVSGLDAEVCRQHPDWAEATRVFFGPSVDACPDLAASVDIAEVEALGGMTIDEIRSIVGGHSSMRPLRRWEQLFPLNRHAAPTAGGAR